MMTGLKRERRRGQWKKGIVLAGAVSLLGGSVVSGALGKAEVIGLASLTSLAAEVRMIRTDTASREQRREQEKMRKAQRQQEEAARVALLPAGTKVEQDEIDRYGVSAYFTCHEISDEVFVRRRGKSFGEDCTTPREDLHYLKVLYCGPGNKPFVGELVCHREISQDLLEIFRELYEQDYPIEKMVLVDDYDGDDLRSAADNNTSCFNFRVASGPSGSLSYHARGKAIDINPLYNPYLWTDETGELHCEPEEGLLYADREEYFPYKMEREDLCCRLFLEHGFRWGGDWETEKDYMHFSRP